jgi:hypothetical protein
MLFQRKGSRVRSPKFFGVVLLVVLLVAGCGIFKPKPILDGRPAPAQVGDPVPVTPVQDPVDLGRFRAKSCDILKREQVAALIVDPPDKVDSGDFSIGGSYACSWSQYRAGTLMIGVPRAGLSGLGELISRQREKPTDFSQWHALSIAGLPAVEYIENPPYFEYNGSRLMSCFVEVGVSDAESLEFKFSQMNEERSQYWGEDRCAAALKAAEFVIGNLRGR